MSRLLKKLIEAGEVSEGYGDDAREKVLSLTEKGRETLRGVNVCSLSFCLIFIVWDEMRGSVDTKFNRHMEKP